MEKLFTIEWNQKEENVEVHLNESGITYLRNVLNKLVEANIQDHIHLMTPNWGGAELTQEKQNQSNDVKLINHLKIVYWK